MKKLTKQDMVLEHLRRYGSISSLEAINAYWCTRLSAVIFSLKKEGYLFDTKMETHKPTGSSFARYTLVE